MRRPIKFRAWDAFRMEMFRVNSLNSYVDRDVDNPLKVVRYQGDSPSQFILMQFTGLTDRKGVEIYEGDMVRATEIDYESGGWRSESSVIGVVEYSLEWGYRVQLKTGHQRLINLSSLKFNSFEVIGNIYQHPELLKGGNPA